MDSPSAVLLWVLWYGWTVNGGDIFIRKIEQDSVARSKWYHAMAPITIIANKDWCTR